MVRTRPDSPTARRAAARRPIATAALAMIWATAAAAGCARAERAGRGPLGPGPARTVAFATSDGGRVEADLYGAGNHGVVLAHGGRFTKESWRGQARALADAGLRVLAINFRGRGASRGGTASDDPDGGYALDVLAAIRYLRDQGAQRVSVVGASFGGWAAADASTMAAPGEIDALVLLAHSPIEAPERMRGRKLFIVARDDPQADGSPRLMRIRDQYERAPPPKRLLILPGAAHAQHLFGTSQGDRALEEIIKFLGAGSGSAAP